MSVSQYDLSSCQSVSLTYLSASLIYLSRSVSLPVCQLICMISLFTLSQYHISVCLSVCHTFTHSLSTIYLSVFLSVSLFVCQSVTQCDLFTSLSLIQLVCLSVSLPIHPSIHPPICLFIYLSVSSTYLSIYI